MPHSLGHCIYCRRQDAHVVQIDSEMAHEESVTAMKREAEAKDRLVGQQHKGVMRVQQAEERYTQLKASCRHPA